MNDKNSEIVKIVERAKNGDRTATEELWRIMYDPLHKFVMKLGLNEYDAQDIVSDSFVEVISHIGQLRENSYFSTWLHTIAKHKAGEFIKKESRHQRISFDTDNSENGDLSNIDGNAAAVELAFENAYGDTVMLPADYAENEDVKSIIAEQIASLSPEHKEALFLFYYQNRSIAEIAELTNTNQNNVKARLFHARKKLKEKLEKLQKEGVILCAVPFFGFIPHFGSSLIGAAGIGIAAGTGAGAIGTAAGMAAGNAAVGTAAGGFSSIGAAGISAISGASGTAAGGFSSLGAAGISAVSGAAGTSAAGISSLGAAGISSAAGIAAGSGAGTIGAAAGTAAGNAAVGSFAAAGVSSGAAGVSAAGSGTAAGTAGTAAGVSSGAAGVSAAGAGTAAGTAGTAAGVSSGAAGVSAAGAGTAAGTAGTAAGVSAAGTAAGGLSIKALIAIAASAVVTVGAGAAATAIIINSNSNVNTETSAVESYIPGENPYWSENNGGVYEEPAEEPVEVNYDDLKGWQKTYFDYLTDYYSSQNCDNSDDLQFDIQFLDTSEAPLIIMYELSPSNNTVYVITQIVYIDNNGVCNTFKTDEEEKQTYYCYISKTKGTISLCYTHDISSDQVDAKLKIYKFENGSLTKLQDELVFTQKKDNNGSVTYMNYKINGSEVSSEDFHRFLKKTTGVRDVDECFTVAATTPSLETEFDLRRIIYNRLVSSKKWNPNKDQAAAAFKDLIEAEGIDKNADYMLYDVDEDDIPEVILYESGSHTLHIYHFYDGLSSIEELTGPISIDKAEISVVPDYYGGYIGINDGETPIYAHIGGYISLYHHSRYDEGFTDKSRTVISRGTEKFTKTDDIASLLLSWNGNPKPETEQPETFRYSKTTSETSTEDLPGSVLKYHFYDSEEHVYKTDTDNATTENSATENSATETAAVPSETS